MPIEVEGVRLIADLVGAGVGVSILPETAVAHDHVGVRQLRIARMPPRRLALVTARGVQLSLADQAVHDAVRRIVRDEPARRRTVASCGRDAPATSRQFGRGDEAGADDGAFLRRDR